MRCLSITILALVLFSFMPDCQAQTQSEAKTSRLRVAVVGLVHGHASGFFAQSLHRPDIQIVGIFEPDKQVFSNYQSQFKLDQALLVTNLDEMRQ